MGEARQFHPPLSRRAFFRRISPLAAGLVSATATLADSSRDAPDLSRTVFSVRRYGAKGDGSTKDTRAIQAAIDAASRQGGCVYLPPGRYLCGTLRLRSHVTLQWENGAELFASQDRADFDPYERLPFNSFSDEETTDFNFALIRGRELDGVALVGPGRIDMARSKRGGPKPIALKLCKNIVIRDLTIENAPNYNISLLGCDFVEIHGVAIRNGYCDGIDPDSCRHVRISDCYVESWDDAIVLKASPSLGYLRACEQVTITNSILTTACNGLKLGTESSDGFRDIVMSNCAIFSNPERWPNRRASSGLSLEMVDGGTLERIAVSNLTMRDVRAPIFVRLGNRGRRQPVPAPGRLSDISISDIIATGAEWASSFTGLPEHPIERLTVRNLRVTTKAQLEQSPWSNSNEVPEFAEKYPDAGMFGQLPAYGLFCRHAAGVLFDSISLSLEDSDARPGAIFDDLSGGELRSLLVQAPRGETPALLFRDLRECLVTNCRALPGAGPWAKATGARTARLSFAANSLAACAKPVEIGNDVDPRAVIGVSSAR